MLGLKLIHGSKRNVDVIQPKIDYLAADIAAIADIWTWKETLSHYESRVVNYKIHDGYFLRTNTIVHTNKQNVPLWTFRTLSQINNLPKLSITLSSAGWIGYLMLLVKTQPTVAPRCLGCYRGGHVMRSYVYLIIGIVYLIPLPSIFCQFCFRLICDFMLYSASLLNPILSICTYAYRTMF